MKKLFNHIKEDRLLFSSFLFSAILLFLSTILIGIFYTHLPPFLPLFNSLPWGYARIGIKLAFFLPILIGWIIVVINSILCSVIYERIVLLSRFVGATTAAACMTILIFTIQILLLIH